MNSFRITFENGNVINTEMNATLEEAKEYYIGRAFQFGDIESHPKDKLIKAIQVEQLNAINVSDFTRINNDVNGNPRFVIHYLQCCPEAWKAWSINNSYAATCKLMNKIGGRKFHNKQYGGGIVFSSYSLPETIRAIEELKAKTK